MAADVDVGHVRRSVRQGLTGRQGRRRGSGCGGGMEPLGARLPDSLRGFGLCVYFFTETTRVCILTPPPSHVTLG